MPHRLDIGRSRPAQAGRIYGFTRSRDIDIDKASDYDKRRQAVSSKLKGCLKSMKSLWRAIGNFRAMTQTVGSTSAGTEAPQKSYRYVFVFTYGRSGSTLLMGYLNSLPGYCIRGENYNVLAHLCSAYQSAKETLGQVAQKSMQAVHPWYGADLVDLGRMRQSVRATFVDNFVNPPAEASVVGCKEIRISYRNIEDFDGFLGNLQEVFGIDVKIIFNHRDIGKTSQSGWWKDTADAHATIAAMDERLRKSRYANAANVFHVEYERLVKGPEHARQLAEFLAVPFDMATYEAVMAERHSY